MTGALVLLANACWKGGEERRWAAFFGEMTRKKRPLFCACAATNVRLIVLAKQASCVLGAPVQSVSREAASGATIRGARATDFLLAVWGSKDQLRGVNFYCRAGAGRRDALRAP